MLKWQLNGIKNQLKKEMLLHNITWLCVMTMELEWKKMNKKQQNCIKKHLIKDINMEVVLNKKQQNKEITMHKLILVIVELKQIKMSKRHLNCIRKQLNREMLLHRLSLVGAIIMEVE